ncbi:MAG: helix-hairpin-helix domain-containing protein [Neisseriaceae bacterium]|nr:helix-hairpin-helix domain-containing protein [Neisseriaceae bacterium]
MKKLILLLSSALFALSNAWAQININTATQTEWEALNGIGPSKAKAIVDYRTQVGGFKSIDEITNVKGIGSKTLEKIRPELMLGVGSGTKALPNSTTKTIPAAPTKAIAEKPIVPATVTKDSKTVAPANKPAKANKEIPAAKTAP